MRELSIILPFNKYFRACVGWHLGYGYGNSVLLFYTQGSLVKSVNLIEIPHLIST